MEHEQLEYPKDVEKQKNRGKDSSAGQVPKMGAQPTIQGLATGHVRPPVKEFLKRGVVPILVERYIGRLNRDKLSARTGETR
jgi:hypothetical protein